MPRHPVKQLPKRGEAVDGKSRGNKLYALLRGGKPIAKLFRLLPPPDICA